jgi:hypothetical protein
MKKQLFGTYSLLALSIPVAMLTLAPNAQAAGLVLGSTATTNMGVYSQTGNSLSNLTNKSGLSATYTSGITDFDSYVSSTTSNSTLSSSGWFSALNVKTGFVTFDLGASYDVNALALWALSPNNSNAVRNFSLYADTDANTSSLGTLLGNFSAVNASGTGIATQSQVFNFATTNTRYIQMNITSNAGGALSGLSEVAFRQAPAAVPEPLTILGAATAAAFGAAFKRRKSQG